MDTLQIILSLTVSLVVIISAIGGAYVVVKVRIATIEEKQMTHGEQIQDIKDQKAILDTRIFKVFGDIHDIKTSLAVIQERTK